jgi:hypothetical protein
MTAKRADVKGNVRLGTVATKTLEAHPVSGAHRARSVEAEALDVGAQARGS